ncbi:GNAT family N-acetyltransferase [Paenibacillus cremeus]|uniref:GNAT family N-acetyltransferase n=1 Tax=Paenibacillus cremeus TaxID=2163881 RepID=A0A559JKF3_9BACL|nr:GNAT family N-acetyltransferase [Paenibacillus cremeus]TVY00345.1 GNAT family N-acetyltransferase [Paenibacillus cremeus]
MAIVMIESDEQIRSTYFLMKQLRPHLEEATYVSRVKEQQSSYGYKLIALMDDEGIARAAAGYRICESLAWGRHVYVDDLITDEATRSRGYAKQLFDWLEEETSKQQCTALHLDSGYQRHDAHRFYLNCGMRIICHHFEKMYK